MSRADLMAELFQAAEAVTPAHIHCLISLGVSRPAIGELGRNHVGFGVVKVSALEDGLYYPGEGQPHLLLPVYEDGELVDLCAFRSSDPDRWLLRTGYGWALGLEHGLGRHTFGDPVPLSASPLDWLRGDTTGLCVLDWDAPETRYLLDLTHLVCATAELASCLRTTLAKPVRFPQISIEEIRNAA